MIESKLVTLINDSVPSLEDGISPLIYTGEEKPYATYRVIYEKDITTLSGAVAKNARFQVDIYADSYSGVKSVKDEIKTALYSFKYFEHDLSITEGYEEETGLYRQILDFNLKI